MSGCNDFVGVREKPFIESLDVLVALCRLLQNNLLSSASESSCRIMGRTIDLDSAFRQLAVDPVCAFAACIAVWSPAHSSARVLVQRALPFGSLVSVHAFARLSEAIRHFFVRYLGIISSAYYDDCGIVDRDCTCESAAFTAEGLLEVLGIRYSTKASKRLPFSESFRILGVELTFNVLMAGGFVIRVTNTEERTAELKSDLMKTLSSGELSPSEASRLRGRLGFFITSLFSRAGALFLRALELRAASDRRGDRSLSADERFALKAALALLSLPPRTVTVRPGPRPPWVFTDAAVEVAASGPPLATIGGLLYEPSSLSPAAFFSAPVPHEVTELWEADAPAQPICQAETFAVVVSKFLWGDRLAERKAIFGVDNVGTQMAMIRMASPVKSISDLLKVTFALDFKHRCTSWYCWVPSVSNPADNPSRLQVSELLAAGVPRAHLSNHVLVKLATSIPLRP
eukprot:3304185-Amphidinium_carterae.1